MEYTEEYDLPDEISANEDIYKKQMFLVDTDEEEQ